MTWPACLVLQGIWLIRESASGSAASPSPLVPLSRPHTIPSTYLPIYPPIRPVNNVGDIQIVCNDEPMRWKWFCGINAALHRVSGAKCAAPHNTHNTYIVEVTEKGDYRRGWRGNSRIVHRAECTVRGLLAWQEEVSPAYLRGAHALAATKSLTPLSSSCPPFPSFLSHPQGHAGSTRRACTLAHQGSYRDRGGKLESVSSEQLRGCAAVSGGVGAASDCAGGGGGGLRGSPPPTTGPVDGRATTTTGEQRRSYCGPLLVLLSSLAAAVGRDGPPPRREEDRGRCCARGLSPSALLLSCSCSWRMRRSSCFRVGVIKKKGPLSITAVSHDNNTTTITCRAPDSYACWGVCVLCVTQSRRPSNPTAVRSSCSCCSSPRAPSCASTAPDPSPCTRDTANIGNKDSKGGKTAGRAQRQPRQRRPFCTTSKQQQTSNSKSTRRAREGGSEGPSGSAPCRSTPQPGQSR